MTENSENSISATGGLEAALNDTQIPDPSPISESTPLPADQFDPSIHAVNEDGSPRLTREGGYAKKRGRKKGGSQAAASSGPVADDDDEDNKRRVAVTVCVGALLAGFRAIGGDEWNPEPGEREELSSAFDEYFRATGAIDLPPGLVLCVVVGQYGIRRLDRPGTQARIGKLMGWITGKKRRAVPSVVHPANYDPSNN